MYVCVCMYRGTLRALTDAREVVGREADDGSRNHDHVKQVPV